MNKQIIIKNTILLLILGLLCGTVATASAAPANITSLSATVTSSQIVINGFSSDNGTVVLTSEFSTNVTVAGDNTFDYTRNGYKVPNLGGDETLTISTYPVESNSTLTIGKLLWNMDTTIPIIFPKLAAYTSPNFNNTAEYINNKFLGGLDITKHLSGVALNIKINGTSNAPEVTIKFIGTRTINANGSFSTAIDTAGFPDGTYIITANGGSSSGTNVIAITLPYTAPAPSSGGGGGGTGGTGGTLNIISGSDYTGDAGEGTTGEGAAEDSGESGDAGQASGEGGADSGEKETTFQTEEPDSSGIFDKLKIFLLALVGMLVPVYMVHKYKK